MKRRIITVIIVWALFCSIVPHTSLQVIAAEGELRGNTSEPIKIACIGDSITYGHNPADWGRTQIQNNWPTVLGQTLGDGYDVRNFGQNGLTLSKSGGTPVWNTQKFTDSKNFQPAIVIIMLGTNDSPGSDSAEKRESLKADLRELITVYRELDSHPVVFIATSPTAFGHGGFGLQPATIHDYIVPLQKEVAYEMDCTVIDLHAYTSNWDAVFPDYIHPNEFGHAAIGKYVANCIQTYYCEGAQAIEEDTPVVTWNGHSYQRFDEKKTWTEAKAYCEQLGGHLVTISSKKETDAIITLFHSGSLCNCYWIGMSRSNTSSAWKWVTGEDVSYYNWAENEPRNTFQGNDENYVHVFAKEYTQGTGIKRVGTWNDAANGGAGYANSFYSDLGFICEWDGSEKDVNISFESLELSAHFSEQYFEKTAYEYNHDLAWLTLCLELSSFSTDSNRYWGEPEENASPDERKSIEKARTQNIRDAYKSLGFSHVEFFNYDKSLNDTSDKVAYAIATKPLSTGETLISVVVRGGGYGCEWSSNFHVGSGEYYHEGFYTAMSEVYGNVVSSIDAAGRPCTLWITGYSRGAAVANLLAGKMDDLSMTDDRVKADKIFAYTFATPQGVTTKMHPSDARYENIFNIVNPGDPVPSVALSSWDFTRYGVTKKLLCISSPSVSLSASPNYHDAVNAINANLKKYNAIKEIKDNAITYYNYYDAGHSSSIKMLLKLIQKVFPSCEKAIPIQEVIADYLELFNHKEPNSYYEWDAISFNERFNRMKKKYGDAFVHAYANSLVMITLDEELLNSLFKLLDNNPDFPIRGYVAMFLALCDVHGCPSDKVIKLLCDMISIQNIHTAANLKSTYKAIGASHKPEVYLAWMDQNEEKVFGTKSGHNWSVSLHCPIDIAVYDAEGNCAAQIENHQVVFSELPVLIEGESTEFFFDESPETYRIVITPTDNGTMTYNITELDENQELVRRTNYLDIPVMPGQEFSGSLLMTEDYSEGMYDLVCVQDDMMTIISADEVFTEGGDVRLAVVESPGGTTTGAGYYYRGDTATMRAYPYDDYEFTGWYRDGQLQTTKPAYRIEMMEDISVQAVFSPTTCSHIWAEEAVEELPGIDDTLAVVCRCEKCGQIQVSMRQKECSHDWVLIETTEATCIEAGTNLYSCSLCGETKSEAIDAFGHNLIRHDAQTPTCTAPGWDAYDTCSRCSYTTFTELLALGHDYKNEIAAPSCTEQGYTKHTCKRCGDSYTDTDVAALGHAWDNGKVTKEPTQTQTGVKTFTCERCGETRTESIPELTHIHNYVSTVTAPTCTNQGFTLHTCSGCGDSYKDSYIAALGHNYQDDVCIRCGARDPDYPGEKPFRFDDVQDESQYYYDAVYWAVDNEITTGTSPTTFSPSRGCTRAQVVTFLWRAAGKPEPTMTENPFADVIEGQYYYKAVLWAVEKGITTGTSPITFRPDLTCTRGQIVTFLWRYHCCPAPKTTANPFVDVRSNVYYYTAILWAVENGITNGVSAEMFNPESTCTRAQIVTFLYRAMK